jgi:hypothetical protein
VVFGSEIAQTNCRMELARIRVMPQSVRRARALAARTSGAGSNAFAGQLFRPDYMNSATVRTVAGVGLGAAERSCDFGSYVAQAGSPTRSQGNRD